MDYSTFRPDSGQPLHTQIRQWLLVQLKASEPLTRLPTDRDLAQGLGVAPLTVKRVMGDLEREGYVTRRRGKGTFLAMQERAVHAPVSAGTNGQQLLVAYPNYFSSEYWSRLFFAEKIARARGWSVVEYKLNPEVGYAGLIIFARSLPGLCGVLVSPVAGSVDRKTFEAFDNLGVPVVIFERTEYLGMGRRVGAVVVDQFKAGYLEMEKLVKAGHRAIGYVANEPYRPDRTERIRGMHTCLRDYGLGPRNLKMMQGEVKPWENSVEAARAICQSLMSTEPRTGLLTDSFNGVLGSLYCLWQMGYKVPDDVSLICGAGHKSWEQYVIPPISSITYEYEREIELAFKLLDEPDMPGGRMLVCDVRMIDRQSVAPPSKSTSTDNDRVPVAGSPEPLKFPSTTLD